MPCYNLGICLLVSLEYKRKYTLLSLQEEKKQNLPFSLTLYVIRIAKTKPCFFLPKLSQLPIVTPRLNTNQLPALFHSYITHCKSFRIIVIRSTQKLWTANYPWTEISYQLYSMQPRNCKTILYCKFTFTNV